MCSLLYGTKQKIIPVIIIMISIYAGCSNLHTRESSDSMIPCYCTFVCTGLKNVQEALMVGSGGKQWRLRNNILSKDGKRKLEKLLVAITLLGYIIKEWYNPASCMPKPSPTLFRRCCPSSFLRGQQCF